MPFRARSFQKANLPCIIMSICDLGQALFNAPVLLQTMAEEQWQHALFWSLCCSYYQSLNCSQTVFPAAGYLPMSLLIHCSDIAGGNAHETAGGDGERQSCVLEHTLISREMLQTPSAGGEVAPRVCVWARVHVCGHAGGWKTKCCWGDNAQRRKESALRELHY